MKPVIILFDGSIIRTGRTLVIGVTRYTRNNCDWHCL